MPFKQTGPNKYVSPSGREYTSKQVKLYYALGGRFPGQKGMDEQLPARTPGMTRPPLLKKEQY